MTDELPPLPEPWLPLNLTGIDPIWYPAIHRYGEAYARTAIAPYKAEIERLKIEVKQADARGDDAMERYHAAEARDKLLTQLNAPVPAVDLAEWKREAKRLKDGCVKNALSDRTYRDEANAAFAAHLEKIK